MRLVDGREIRRRRRPRGSSRRTTFFDDQLTRTTLALELIVAGIEKLVIVDIALERDHDNPQLIFESLNSTGLDLSQADLIRNYVLMGLPQRSRSRSTRTPGIRWSSPSRPSIRTCSTASCATT